MQRNFIAHAIQASVMCLTMFGQIHAQSAQPTSTQISSDRVSGAGLLIRVVADLDKTAQFYAGLGLEIGGPPHDGPGPRPYMEIADLATMYDAPGPTRFLSFKPVNSDPGPSLLLIEFKDVPKQPVTSAVQDPGSTMLRFQVRKLEPVLAALRQLNTPLLAKSGSPVKTRIVGKAGRTIMVRDPDGALIEFTAADAPAESVNAGNYLSMTLAIAVNDAEKTMSFYRNVFGFVPHASDSGRNAVNFAAAGLQSGRYRQISTVVPGTAFTMEFLEFQGVPRKPMQVTPHDVGAAIIRMKVSHIDDIIADMQAAGQRIVSAGNKKLVYGKSEIFIAADPNGFYLEPGEPKE